MESDTSHIVNLEVTVPRIVVATGKHSPEQGETLPIQQTGEDEEQVRLFSIEDQQQDMVGETSAHMIHAIRFRLFRMQVPALGRPLLFQVLRRWKRPVDEDQEKENALKEGYERQYVTDASTFSVEFRPQSGAAKKVLAEVAGQTLQPDANHVIIYLDNEGIPGSYSIDGAHH